MPDLAKNDLKPDGRRAVGADAILQKALAERERYLKARPHMRDYQTEIDSVLDKSGSHQGRLMVLGMLIQGKILELQMELAKLDRIIQKDG